MLVKYATILRMEKMELDIVSNGMNGEGIARNNGKVYFVNGAIKGERVTANIIKETMCVSRCSRQRFLQRSHL